jgi:hypothetical protein
MESKSYKTVAALARAVGIARQNLHELLNRSDWPTRRHPPFSDADLKTVLTWRSSSLQEDRAAPATPEHAEVRVLKDQETMLLTRLKRELLEGKYVERSLHDRALLGLTDVFVAALSGMEQAIPLAVADLTAEQRGNLEKVIADRFAQARQQIAERGRIELARTEAVAMNRVKELTRGRGRPAVGTGKGKGKPPKKHR